MARHRCPGIDQRDLLGQHVGEQRFQKRIVGTTQNHGIATLRQQGLHITGQQLARGGTGQLASFDALDQARTGLGNHPHVAGETIEQRGELRALQGTGSRQDADDATACRSGGRLYRWLHADQRHLRIALAQLGDPDGGRGVAGQHQRLGSLIQQKRGDRTATLANEVGALLAVGHIATISQVQQSLPWQARANLTQHRQPTHAGVEHANRGVRSIHCAFRRPRRPGRA